MTRATRPGRGVVAFEAIALPSEERIGRSLPGPDGPVPEQAGAYAPLAWALQDQAGPVGTVERPERSEGKVDLSAITTVRAGSGIAIPWTSHKVAPRASGRNPKVQLRNAIPNKSQRLSWDCHSDEPGQWR